MDTRPKTLLEMAGAPRHPSPLDQAALVLIDVQREYVDGGLALPGVGPALAEVGRLLEAARQAGTPVFHVVHHGKPGGALFNPEGPFAAIADAARPREGEAVVVKGLPNSFAGTALDERIRETGRRELIVAGFMTHMCVSATVRSALDHSYRCTVVAGACATRDLPDPLTGERVPAETLHRAALAALADRFAIVVPDAAALVSR